MDTKPYIVINDEHDEEPTEDELGLDFNVDMEYNTPYTTYGDDLLNVGCIAGEGGIFDDR